MSFRQSTSLPSLAHSSAQIFATFSGMGLGGLRTTSTLKPISSSAHLLSLPSYPASSHRCERRESPHRADSSRSLSPSWSGTFALCTLTLSNKPSVSTSRCRFLPRTFLFPSYPRCSPPTPVVFVDWESAMPALGSGSLPKRLRTRSRNAPLRRSKVPSIRHLPNHQ